MGANPTPAARLRAQIEDIRARHGEYYFSRIEPMGNYCNSCGHEWPCDAATLADKLEQAVTALELMTSAVDYAREIMDHDGYVKDVRHMDGMIQAARAQFEIERLREPLPERPRCRVCGRRDGLDAVVSDEVWAALGFDPGWYVCLWCMDRRAAEVGITASATLYFAGEAISGGNETEREAVVLDQMAELRAEIERLRAAGDALADEVKAYGDGEHNEFGRVFTAMHNYRAALRRMAGGE